MLLQLIRSGDIESAVIYAGALIFVVFCTMPVHEFAHAYAAYRLGDDTARLKGRLSLNPLAHLSLFGVLMIFIVGFGYAKPVPVNIRNFKNRKRDFALTSLAGPVSNLIMATLFFIILNFVIEFMPKSTLLNVVFNFFFFAANVNVSLAVFNLLPIPPLDGSRILGIIIPDKYYYKILNYERYIIYVVFALLFTGVLRTPLLYLSDLVMRGISFITGLPFGMNILDLVV